METRVETIEDNREKVTKVITLLRDGRPEDIQTIIENIITVASKERGEREICNAAIRYLNRLMSGGDINNAMVENVLKLMHILGLQDGDLHFRDRLTTLTMKNVNLGQLRTMDDARRFANKCATVDLSEYPDARKIAEWLIMNFVNNEELRDRLSSLFKLSSEEIKKLVEKGRENFRSLISSSDATHES